MEYFEKLYVCDPSRGQKLQQWEYSRKNREIHPHKSHNVAAPVAFDFIKTYVLLMRIRILNTN